MNIPKSVKVGGQTFKVIKDYVFTERVDINAQCDSDYNEIKLGQLWREKCRTRQEDIFLHEIIHAVDNIYNGNKLQEEDVVNIGQGLYQVLTDNKIF